MRLPKSPTVLRLQPLLIYSPTPMSPDTELTQAAQAGDASLSATDSYVAVPVVPVNPVVADVQNENEEAKKQRISQAAWQKNAEEAEKGKKLETNLKELGINSTEDIQKLKSETEMLREENRRKDWEIEHPIARSPKYEEEWKRVNKEKRFDQLTFDERWSLINREKSAAKTEEPEFQMSSVPMSSRGSVPVGSAIDPETAAIGAVMGYTEDDYRKAGLLG